MQISDIFSAFGSNQTKALIQQLGMITGVDRAIAQAQNTYSDGQFNLGDLAPVISIDTKASTVTVSVGTVSVTIGANGKEIANGV